jgi:glycosyltransferase involved in cell wall biosynthesis
MLETMDTSIKVRHILYLASWYPQEFNPVLGIFIRRHALAAAKNNNITVLHAVADSDLEPGAFRIQRNEEGRLHELILYYGRKNERKTGIFAWVKHYLRLKNLYTLLVDKAISEFGKADAVHLHVVWPLGHIAANISKRLKVPLVVSEHWTGYYPQDGRYRGLLMKWLTKKTMASAKTLIVLNEAQKSILKTHGLAGNTEMIPNAVNHAIFRYINEPRVEQRILVVAAFDDRQKNISGILEAFANFRTSHPHATLSIIGGGTDEAMLKKRCRDLGLREPSVTFEGLKNEEEIATAMQHASILVLNSYFENQPVVILEALLCGLPVIAPDVGGISEIINPNNGIIFKAEEPKGLLLALEEWQQSPSRFNSQKISEEAAKIYSFEAVAKNLDTVYKNVMP